MYIMCYIYVIYVSIYQCLISNGILKLIFLVHFTITIVF